MVFKSLSPKQTEIFTFPYEDYDALICDGAVRSGKSSMMMVSFILWAMDTFNGCNFGICGKTVRSAERNIIAPFMQITSMARRFKIIYRRSLMLMTVERGGVINNFYVFGGKDESSYALIQGITLSGVLFDEVALMPQSFVEQGITRTLAEDRAKLFFNCNPESPSHWFYEDWIQQPEKHRAKHLHFLMTDNPGLSEKALERAAASFSGVFYDRYILGLWKKAEGLIFPMFDIGRHTFKDEETPQGGEYYVSIDYGTINPFAAGLWCISGKAAYCVKEYYFDSRKAGYQMTDEQYADEVEKLAEGKFIRCYVIDPSAASFMACMRRRRHNVIGADNDVLPGIRNTASAFQQDRIKFHVSCENAFREFGLYSWDEKTTEDKPIKQQDHFCDSVRYLCRTILRRKFRYLDTDIPIANDSGWQFWTGRRLDL